MTRPLIWSELNEAERRQALSRPTQRGDAELGGQVREVVEGVRTRGWEGLCEHAFRLDGAMPERLEVAPFAEQARSQLSDDKVGALKLAVRNITAFHAAAMPRDVDVETVPGLRVRKLWRPIDRVGLYIPGGSAPLFSSLMMLGIPASIAGVVDIIVATPPRPEGGLSPVLALAAELCGIKAVWTVGGAQAIAALAFGAGEIEPVMKICGPGNAYVNEAKRIVSQMPGGPAIDLPAGPSELMVIADGAADPELIAADLLSQAEHDSAAQVMLVTTSARLAERVALEVAAQVETLPRANVALKALQSARNIITPSLAQAIEIANDYAPEHLSLAVDDPNPLIPSIRNAGAVFAGKNAAESFGDYLAGSSHVLPTDGAARAWSGVSVDTFMKAMTVQEVGEAAAHGLAGQAAALARLEGLEAHARAAERRGQIREGCAA